MTTIASTFLIAVLSLSESSRDFGTVLVLASSFGLLYAIVWGPAFLYVILILLRKCRRSAKTMAEECVVEDGKSVVPCGVSSI